jgi:hypothetical protein
LPTPVSETFAMVDGGMVAAALLLRLQKAPMQPTDDG